MLTLLLLFSCVPKPDLEGVEADASRRYVLASSLNLRDAPGGLRVGILAINSPVRVLEEVGDQARVRVGNGREGWVPVAYLAEAPLTVADALAAGEVAATPAEALAWAQRATALDPRDEGALTALAEAYRDTGQHELAMRLEERLEWPDDILLAGAHGQTADGRWLLEWTLHLDRQQWAPDGELTPEQLWRLGVVTGREVWVLPDRGAAVRGTVVGARQSLFNPCDGTWGFTLVADVVLPEGEHAIAYTLASPPASWREPAPTADLEAAKAIVLARIGVDDAELLAVPYADGVLVRSVRTLPPASAKEGVPRYKWADWQVADGWARKIGGLEGLDGSVGYEVPVVGRDLEGDGAIDVIYEWEGCAASLLDDRGIERARTGSLCCGC